MLQTIKALIHNNFIFPRRVNVLASFIATYLPPHSQVIDIGSGNGLIAKKVMQLRPDVSIQGVDVHKRDVEYIPVTLYDGQTLPFEDKQFDAALFIDVLHHTNNILQLLQEAKRISRQVVLIKDHVCESSRDRSVLSYMDDVGNTRFGVTIPQNYLSKSEWNKCFEGADLRITDWNEQLHLYPIPIDYIFGRRLHFFGVLATECRA